MENNKPWVLITGAQGGLGKALVGEFVANNYKVIATDLVDAQLELENVVSIQNNLERIAVDESYANRFKNQIDEITGESGLSVLINNAAVQILGAAKDLTRSQWQASFNVNLHAPFFLSQLFLDDLAKNEGAIVNISSIHATQTKKEFVAYATTKAALSAMTRNMVLDVGNRVRINAIEPAAIATEMLKASFNGHENKLKQLEDFHPIGRVGTPIEVAKLAVFLSSEDARFVQGACISASGGIQGCLSDPT